MKILVKNNKGYHPPHRFRAVFSFAIICIIVVVVTYTSLPNKSNEENSFDPANPARDAHSDSFPFLVRNGKFDCSTLRDSVPLRIMQNIPGIISHESSVDAFEPTRDPDGNSYCFVSHISTGDIAGLDHSTREDATIDRNSLRSLELPLDYRSFGISTLRSCPPHDPNIRSTDKTILDEFSPLPGQEWQIFKRAYGDPLSMAFAARLIDPQMGCLTAIIRFPQEDVSPIQEQTSIKFLKNFVNAIAHPLGVSIEAEKKYLNNKEPALTNTLTTPQPTFRNRNTLDCRSYILSTSIVQQEEIGLVGNFERIPIDILKPLSLPTETPLYRVESDKKSVTCWLKFESGEILKNSFLPPDLHDAIPISLITTSPDSDFNLPSSNFVDAAGLKYEHLPNWEFFSYIPGDSQALSAGDSRLTFENSKYPSINLYRCDSKSKKLEKRTKAAEGNCLILSAPIHGPLYPDALPTLSQLARNIDRIAFND